MVERVVVAIEVQDIGQKFADFANVVAVAAAVIVVATETVVSVAQALSCSMQPSDL